MGVHGVALVAWDGVRFNGDSPHSFYDYQAVPVYINPAPPAQIELLTSSEFNDQLTNFNNSNTDTRLRLRVSGVVPGAEVTVYADGQVIGSAVAQLNTVVVVTYGTLPLNDGNYSITAVQTFRNQAVNVGNAGGTVDLASQVSSPLEITVDTIAPQITSVPAAIGAEGRLYTYNVETPDESGDGAKYRLKTAPAGMLIDPDNPDNDTGLITWTPSGTQTGIQQIEVVAADLAGNEVTQQFTVEVSAAPRLQKMQPMAVNEGSDLTFTAVATGGQGTITYSLRDDSPEGATINPDTGEVSWTTTEADGPGRYMIVVVVTDSIGASSSDVMIATVNEVNQPPELAPIGDRTGEQSIKEGQTLQFTAAASDQDVPANPLTFDLAPGAPNGAGIDPTTGVFTWIPNEYQGGQNFTITVRVWDRHEIPAEETFAVTVEEVDDPPVFRPVDRQQVEPGEQLRVTVEAWDPDDPANEIVYSLDSAPAGAQINRTTGEVTWNVPPDFMDDRDPFEPVQLVVRATEDVPDGLFSTQTLEVVVQDPAALGAAILQMTAKDVEEALDETLHRALLDESPRASADESASRFPAFVLDGGLAGGPNKTGLFGTQFGSRVGSSVVVESAHEDQPVDSRKSSGDEEEDEISAFILGANDQWGTFLKSYPSDANRTEISDAAFESMADEEAGEPQDSRSGEEQASTTSAESEQASPATPQAEQVAAT